MQAKVNVHNYCFQQSREKNKPNTVDIFKIYVLRIIPCLCRPALAGTFAFWYLDDDGSCVVCPRFKQERPPFLQPANPFFSRQQLALTAKCSKNTASLLKLQNTIWFYFILKTNWIWIYTFQKRQPTQVLVVLVLNVICSGATMLRYKWNCLCCTCTALLL